MVTKAERETDLRKRFGDVLTLSDLAAVLRYPSVGAVRKARERGQLPVALVQMPPRRGWFATTEAVAELLCALEHSRCHVDEDEQRIRTPEEDIDSAKTR
ncbi:hypothetical protein IMW82_02830 [Rhodanobacter sp. B2A1Ga4]|nr:hypothetical protein [Rhodanobacter sp. B2A1Ga4]